MIRVICVGKIKEKWIKAGVDEFLKRIKRFSKIEVIELKDSDVEKEGEKILSLLKNQPVLLDEKGKRLSSKEFSQFIKYKDIDFIIGSSNGTSNNLKDNIRDKISISDMTFTHEMARLFLIEQIYRGFTINKNIPYHK